ncbi:MAG: antibiotic biosynthesis monooxygenase family protein [Ilumatobacteraceae bacterium]
MARIVTVFRNRLREGARAEYAPMATEMSELARAMPGFVDAKTFVAEDGERVTIVTFADRASHDAWRDHPRHGDAQRRGSEDFYEQWSVQVAEETHSRAFTR